MARFQRASLIDIEELEALADAAEGGNALAEERLRDLNETYSRRASQRMRELENRDMNTKALQYAQHYLDQRDRTRFGAGKSADIDEVIENLQQARKFLSWETSTVGGERARVEGMLDTLRSHGIIDEFENEREKRSFLNFLESDAFADYKKMIGSGIIGEAQNAIANGATVDELNAVYQEYKAGNVGAIESWESWTRL